MTHNRRQRHEQYLADRRRTTGRGTRRTGYHKPTNAARLASRERGGIGTGEKDGRTAGIMPFEAPEQREMTRRQRPNLDAYWLSVCLTKGRRCWIAARVGEPSFRGFFPYPLYVTLGYPFSFFWSPHSIFCRLASYLSINLQRSRLEEREGKRGMERKRGSGRASQGHVKYILGRVEGRERGGWPRRTQIGGNTDQYIQKSTTRNRCR